MRTFIAIFVMYYAGRLEPLLPKTDWNSKGLGVWVVIALLMAVLQDILEIVGRNRRKGERNEK